MSPFSQHDKMAIHKGRFFVIGFLAVHGMGFLGAGYAVSYFDPRFSLLHSGIGLLSYLIILVVVFPGHFIKAFAGALATLLLGYYWGDFLIDIFYPSSLERTSAHQMYATMIAFYLYLYADIALSLFFEKPPKLS